MGNNALRDTTPLLVTKNLSKHFGGLAAVEHFNMIIKRGEILGLIGPNGSGKTTTFNLITGFLHPSKGNVIYKGEDITHLPPYAIVKKGIVRSFQENILFMDKTIRENVLVGFHTKFRNGFFKEMINARIFCQERAEIEIKVNELLQFMNLIDLKDQLARNLLHGFQRMLGVAVALATEPELLLLDEPVSGMNNEETMEMMKLIRKIRDKGVTIFSGRT